MLREFTQNFGRSPMSSLKSNKNSSIVQEALFKSYFVESSSVVKSTHLKFMDFCAGIGGGRLAFENCNHSPPL